MIHTTQSLPEGTFSRSYMFVRGTLSRHIKNPYRHCVCVVPLLFRGICIVDYLFPDVVLHRSIVPGRSITPVVLLRSIVPVSPVSGVNAVMTCFYPVKEKCDHHRRTFIKKMNNPFCLHEARRCALMHFCVWF